jgi:hypothetical protein
MRRELVSEDRRLGFCSCTGMATSKTLRNYAGRKLARRLTRSIPYVGAAIALFTIGSAIRRKGLFGGTVHSGLDAIPFVGGAKNLAEMVRGRDFIPDRGPVR